MSGTDYTLTPNIGLYKPISNADINQWGSHLNLNADKLDTLFAPPVKQLANVKDFGAIGDGVADDTAAINAAIASVVQLTTTYYNPVMSAAVVFPPGSYKTGGIDLPAAVSLSGAGTNQTTIFIRPSANRSVIRVLEEPVSNPLQWAPRMQGRISGITVNGNPSVQSGTSHGIEMVDTSYTTATRYGTGADIYDVRIVGTLNCGLYVGKNRNNGMILNLRVSYAGTYGVQFQACYDWAAQNLGIGVSGLDGLHIFQCAGIAFDGLIIWMSSGSGVVVQQCGSYMLFSNMQSDTNQQYGFVCDPVNSSWIPISQLAISNAHFRNNGIKTDNTYSSIYLHNIVAITLSNILFNWDSQQPNKCRFLIETDTSGYVNTVNLTYSTTPGTTVGNLPLCDSRVQPTQPDYRHQRGPQCLSGTAGRHGCSTVRWVDDQQRHKRDCRLVRAKPAE